MAPDKGRGAHIQKRKKVHTEEYSPVPGKQAITKKQAPLCGVCLAMFSWHKKTNVM